MKIIINLPLSIQRKLCKAYEDTRLREANNLIFIRQNTTYGIGDNKSIYASAREDILKFVSVFEDSIKDEVEKSLEKYSLE